MDSEFLSEQFEENRPHLRAVAYRMLGSLNDAEDAVQEAWLRLSRSETSGIENLGGWLTTVVSRVCLDVLRSRRLRREESLDARVIEPSSSPSGGTDPEQETILAESVGLALLVVLDTLTPAERLAFVLHDMFAVPFEDIALIIDRSPTAARQLASRARRRVQGRPAAPATELERQREVVEAFLAAARSGNFDALVAVLDPDMVLRGEAAGGRRIEVRGATTVASQALAFRRGAQFAQLALINGAVGFVFAPRGRLVNVATFTIEDGRITEIEFISDRARLRQLQLAVL